MLNVHKRVFPLLAVLGLLLATLAALEAPATSAAGRHRPRAHAAGGPHRHARRHRRHRRHHRRHHRHSSSAARACPHADTLATDASKRDMRRAVLCLVNLERTSRGLPPLNARPGLTRSAQLWTQSMVSANIFTHGSDFAARILAAGYRWGYAGENIASGFRTPRSVVKAWMGSEGHCRNILDPHFADVGTGIITHPTGVANIGSTWTQDFGLLLGHNPPSNNTGPQSHCPY